MYGYSDQEFFDLWLQRKLRLEYDPIITAPIPDELLSLLHDQADDIKSKNKENGCS